MPLGYDDILNILTNDDTSVIDIASDDDDEYENNVEESDVGNLHDLDEFIIEEEINDEDGSNQNFTVTTGKNVTWKKNVKYIAPAIDWHTLPCSEVCDLPKPITFFEKYFSDAILNLMVDMTNLYAVQNDISRFPSTTLVEMKKYVGIHILMGNLNFPRLRMYWDPHMGIPVIKENMTFHRLTKLRQAIHVVDVTNKPDTTDKLWKIRPLYDNIKNVCSALPLETNLCIDEQIMPFKGKLIVKQYVKNKPKKWGLKIFELAGVSGKIYDFLLYQDATTEVRECYKSFGVTAETVLHLCDRITEANHSLCFDNYFNSYNLLQCLHTKQIYAIGTARRCRFFNPPLANEKALKLKGRGSWILL